MSCGGGNREAQEKEHALPEEGHALQLEQQQLRWQPHVAAGERAALEKGHALPEEGHALQLEQQQLRWQPHVAAGEPTFLPAPASCAASPL